MQPPRQIATRLHSEIVIKILFFSGWYLSNRAAQVDHGATRNPPPPRNPIQTRWSRTPLPKKPHTPKISRGKQKPRFPTPARDRIGHIVSAVGLPGEGSHVMEDILQRYRAGLSASLLRGQLTSLRLSLQPHFLHIGVICCYRMHAQNHIRLDFRCQVS